MSVIRETDGRYFVSFVAEVAETPLPEASTITGVDLGLADIVRSDGCGRRSLRHGIFGRRSGGWSRRRRCCPAQRRDRRIGPRPGVRVACSHRRVRESLLDHHHMLARRLIHENQVVAVAGLAVAWLARARLTKSVQDAGWTTLLRLLEEKATQHGQQTIRVGRWTPSTRACSQCGRIGEAKPLHVRRWMCDCGAPLDRDHNAAISILDSAGLAESLNACGGNVRLQLAAVEPGEARTRRTDPPQRVRLRRNTGPFRAGRKSKYDRPLLSPSRGRELPPRSPESRVGRAAYMGIHLGLESCRAVLEVTGEVPTSQISTPPQPL